MHYMWIYICLVIGFMAGFLLHSWIANNHIEQTIAYEKNKLRQQFAADLHAIRDKLATDTEAVAKKIKSKDGM